LRSFRDLEVWKKAHQLTMDVYRVSGSFPREELYGLIGQMRRSAASIPANIAEGCGRDGVREFARFLGIAMGSASELEYHMLLARDLESLPLAEFQLLEPRVIEIKRMLTRLIQRLKADSRLRKADG